MTLRQVLKSTIGPASNKGLYKVMSKMGISTIASYRCTQLFEAIGHRPRRWWILCFQRRRPAGFSGANFADFQQDQHNLARQAWLVRKPLPHGGLLKFVHGGEYHTYNPDVVQTLQTAVRSGNYADYNEYARLVNERPVATLRDLLALQEGRQSGRAGSG